MCVCVTAEPQGASLNCLPIASTSTGFEKSIFKVYLDSEISYKCSLKVLFSKGILESPGLVLLKMMFIQQTIFQDVRVPSSLSFFPEAYGL